MVPAGSFNSNSGIVRRHVAQQLRVQQPQIVQVGAGCVRHQMQVNGMLQLHRFHLRRFLRLHLHAVERRILGHQRHRDDDRHVVLSFLRQRFGASAIPR